MQAELERLRGERAAWRELVAALHEALKVPYPSTEDGPEYNRRWNRNRDLHRDRMSTMCAHTRGIITALVDGLKDAPTVEAGLIREVPAKLDAEYPYL